MKLWQGRLAADTDELAARLNRSLDFDSRLAPVDVAGSIAWTQALSKAGVLTEDEEQEIIQGLESVLEEIQQNTFEFLDSDEDIHTAVERGLTEKIGPLGGKLHTGRSRNDQVATDFRLWVKEALLRIDSMVLNLQKTLTQLAEVNHEVIMPGYTHLQQAQPVLLSHWFLSHLWPLQRDRMRLAFVFQETDVMPLGSAALAGTAYPIDRESLASALKFKQPSPNSMDAVSDRDFAVDFVYNAAVLGTHLSRLAEQLILFSSREFGYFELDDAYATGSSIMPQKKNPDMLEIVRSKTGQFNGHLITLLTMLKALPSVYDKDLQEDKPAVFACYDTLTLILPVMNGLLSTLKINQDNIKDALDPALMATDLADDLVKKGVPFREAYGAVAKAVRKAADLQTPLNELPLHHWQELHPAFDQNLYTVINPESAVTKRAVFGGTAPDSVKEQISLAKKCIMKVNQDQQ